jgi:Ca2+-binding RTX toxin-like protein
MAHTDQEQANISTIQGLFELLRQKEDQGRECALDAYVDTSFTDQARSIVVRGGEEIYAKDSKSGGYPTDEELADTNAYSDKTLSHERLAVLPFTKEYIGTEGVKEFFDALESNFTLSSELASIDDQKYIINGDNLIVYGHITLPDKFTGNLFKSPFTIDIELTNGKIKQASWLFDSYTLAASTRTGGTWQGKYGENPPINAQWGTRDSNTLIGDTNPNQLNDQLYGFQGDDTLIGGEGDDILYGGSGNDDLKGGKGNDTLYGGIGSDTLMGGAGNNVFVLESTKGVAAPSDEGFDTIVDFKTGEDRIGLSGGITVEQLAIAQTNNDVELKIKSTGETLAILSNTNAADLNNASFVKFQASPPLRDYPTSIDTSTDTSIDDPNNETKNRGLVEGFFNSFYDGTIFDYIQRNFASDSQYIVIRGDNDYSEVYDSKSNDYAVNFSQERSLLTPPTKEWSGIEGAQGFIASLGQGNDLTDPITGFFPDKYVVDGSDVGVAGRFVYRNRTTGKLAAVPFTYDFHIEGDKIKSIYFLEDTYSYTQAARQFGTWTSIYNGVPTDFTFGSNSNDNVTGGSRTDWIYGYLGDDVLDGGEGDDTLYGGGGNDWLTGGSGNDTLNGGDGYDVLIGGFGNDSLTGGQGSDRFVLEAGAGTDTITDFQSSQDRVGLASSVKFEQLVITQSMGTGNQDTLISLKGTNEKLAILKNISPVNITAADFQVV